MVHAKKVGFAFDGVIALILWMEKMHHLAVVFLFIFLCIGHSIDNPIRTVFWKGKCFIGIVRW